MRMIRPALLCLLLLTAAAPAPVPLTAQPGTTVDALARQLVAQDLREASRAGEQPLLLIGTAALGGERPALFIQLQSPRECGSAGCNTSVFVWTAGGYKRALDGVAGRLTVSGTRHHGLADLVTDTEQYAWDGRAYRDTRPAPPVNLRPRHR